MTLQQACSMAHIHCLYTQSPQNAIQSQQTDKVGNNGIVEIYDVKSYQIESNVVKEFQFWIDGNLKLNQRPKCEVWSFKMNPLRLYSSSLNLTIHRYFILINTLAGQVGLKVS